MTFDQTRDVVDSTFGYHPIARDAIEVLSVSRFVRVLAIGPSVPDAHDLVVDIHWLPTTEVQLPEGVYWFAVQEGNLGLVVSDGAPSQTPERLEATEALSSDLPLSNALGWFDALWDQASVVARPAFDIGEDVMTTGTGQDARIRSRRFRNGQWVYDIRLDGSNQTVPEGNLQPRPGTDSPADWVQGPVDPASRFAATITRAKLLGSFTDTVFSFRATRTIFLPYQFKPVMKFLETGDLHLLVADEVGLGKTIEAGLLWTELEARRRANRVLVVCPSALVEKWQMEMEERFGFELEELTAERLEELFRRLEVDRPSPRVAYVCSIERLRVWDRLAQATALGLQFDFTVVDEAHAFRNTDTKSNALGELIGQWSDALLFLSATPLNLRSRDLFNLLELLSPGEFGDLESLEHRLQPNTVLHRVVDSLFDRGVTADDRRALLRELDSMTFGPVLKKRPEYLILEKLLDQDELEPRDVVQVKRLAQELHALSASVTRTRKVEVEVDKTVREARVEFVNWTEAEAAFYAEFVAWCSQRAAAVDMPLHFVMQMPLRLAGSCLPMAARQVLQWTSSDEVDYSGDGDEAVELPSASRRVPPSADLMRLAESLDHDAKLDQFLKLVDELLAQGKQFLVFTFSRDVVAYLYRALNDRARAAVMHGGVQRDDRQPLMADFRNGRYDLMIATKVASEGLDFEFCSTVVNYDLPWNPMEVEQRIGRIDRIGQKEEKILIFNLNAPGTIESAILERVMDRIGVFERFIGGLEPIITSKLADITAAAVDFSLNKGQSDLRLQHSLAAVEQQKLNLEAVEDAAQYLMSSDGVDIDGLEKDLTSNGRYVGQQELALLIDDWATTVGGAKVTTAGDVLTIVGNLAMANQVQASLPAGSPTRKADFLISDLRNEIPVRLSLDQEVARTGKLPLLSANHPLTQAALTVPGHRQTRFAAVTITRPSSDIPTGDFLLELAVMRWSGLKPSNELWTQAVDLSTGKSADQAVGGALLAALAAGALRDGDLSAPTERMLDVLSILNDELTDQMLADQAARTQENTALISSRRVSVQQVHQRKVASINQRIDTLLRRGRASMRGLFDAQLIREDRRLAEAEAAIAASEHCSIQLEPLAVAMLRIEA